MHDPQEEHQEAALRVVRSLKGTVGHGVLFLKNGHLDFHGYTDADWAGNLVDRRSTGGYFTFVSGNLVMWRSKKQKVVTLSSAEAEFRGIKSGLTKILWLRRLMKELNLELVNCCVTIKLQSVSRRIQYNMIELNTSKLIGTS
ncbi:secreted RxLR effector protein 161-like [Salvia splendens]|uniref:secreted RxLR effector protein 161-like n=1 Tax=Salvia splendens TaxID=180675 RepID=UPI001C27F9BC|nr:secreted RxLR effector protein 161-like [Salvia splendens]